MPKKYQATALKDKKNRNRQNAHISFSYETANFALINLMKMGVTVLSVNIEGRTPQIEVLSHGTQKIPKSQIHATINTAGGRSQIKRAVLNNCLIQWESPVTY